MSWWPLADPIACPGLFDLLVIVISRTWRELPLGSLIAAGNTFLLAVALVFFARAIRKEVSNIAVTIAIALAAAASAEFVRVLAPSPAAALAVTIGVWIAVLRERFTLPLLALLAATVPPFSLPMAIVAGRLAWPQGTIRIGQAVLSVIGTSAAVQLALGSSMGGFSWLGCLFPHAGLQLPAEALPPFNGLLTGNPVASALALLGLFSRAQMSRETRRTLLPMTVIACWGAAIVPQQAAVAIAPFFIVFWVLAARGLAEVWEYAAQTAGGKAGAAALGIALVVLQGLNAQARGDLNVTDDGHRQLTLAEMAAIVGALPKGAGVVEEDAISGLLTRALPSRMRAPDRIQIVQRDAEAIRGALLAGSVFALPRSQRALQHLGFELADPPGIAVSGLAEVRQAHACTTELDATPNPVSAITGQRGIALVAGDEASRDIVVIILAGESQFAVSELGWPPESLRGFQPRTFDMTRPADRTNLADELRSYELASWPVPSTGYVARLEIWRTPESPLALPVALGNPATSGIARRTGTSANQHLRLCPSFPFEVRPLVRRP